MRILAIRGENLASLGAPFEIDLARFEEIDIFLREIVSHYRDDLHGCEVAGGKSDICGRASQHAVNFSMRRFHAIICYGSYND